MKYPLYCARIKFADHSMLCGLTMFRCAFFILVNLSGENYL
ncbi:hypothetical protein D1AOALGA4SA_6575 [Olavius algarvensis Delta 1 endosymbiont]|nr:hypothetical protein D1AOALGA4SA_6575 [Olavius algarvensis Delta 1 endosymbiont]